MGCFGYFMEKSSDTLTVGAFSPKIWLVPNCRLSVWAALGAWDPPRRARTDPRGSGGVAGGLAHVVCRPRAPVVASEHTSRASLVVNSMFEWP